MIGKIPEADWVKDMRAHFAAHGFYRQDDLDRLLGKPWQSAALDASGNIILKDRT